MQPYYESLFEDSWEVHGIEWIAVFAYFDETGTHDSALITAVAGYLFSKDGAKLFRRMCHENIDPLLPLDKHGQRVYHSTKCIGGFDQFATLTVTQRERIVDLLVETIKKSMMLGVVIAIENKDYEDAIADSSRTRELAGDKYSVCLTRCIENMAAWLNRKDIPGRVQYIFEAGCNHQKEADAILKGISTSPELKRRYRWHSYAFADKGPDIPQLFAPDLLAWEWQRAHINAMNPQRGEWRLTLKRLFDGSPHIPEYETSISVGIRAIVNAFYGVTPIA